MGRIKGVAVLKMIKFLRSNREQAARLLPENLHRYLDCNVLVSSWYPEDDMMELMRAMARMIPGVPAHKVWEWLGGESVRHDFERIYSSLIIKGNPERTIRMYPVIWDRYHDSGVCNVDIQPGGRASIEIEGFLTQVDEFCRLQAGHFCQILLLAGAESANSRCSRVGDSSAPARWDLSWTLRQETPQPSSRATSHA